MTRSPTLSAAISGDREAFDQLVGEHGRAVLLFAYHLTGSVHDADDVLQEVLLRAWRNLATFTGAGSIGAWLRRIATNVVIDRGRAARRRPEIVGLPWDPNGDLPPPEEGWIEPFPDARMPMAEHRLASREALELGFVGLMQQLPVRQRAVWVLRELAEASAAETAEWLGMTEDAVTSALQRARSTLGAATPGLPVGTDLERRLAARYAAAWEARDLDALVDLLHHDVVVAMPPYSAWISGREGARTFVARHLRLVEGPPWRVLAVEANRRPALAIYRPSPGGHAPFAIFLLTEDQGRARRLDVYVMPTLFRVFGLPC